MADIGTSQEPRQAGGPTWGQKVARRTRIARNATYAVIALILVAASLPIGNILYTLGALGLLAWFSWGVYGAWTQ
jgi:hypothetical protein